ncbi:GntR family transcriptional regulator [Halalkalibacter oceani]|uniref:GntR family transcriptional regulator n=1 Tax=Halalkalibacter oceani TaxID=1653776 RepID=A0A9X2DQF1_9BACI|nr:GntR family transcriptional regulator [Halalkalibacter oceani]MCM3714781.1 GntR family transcriptional regulator [Halalkalibacter oceani]
MESHQSIIKKNVPLYEQAYRQLRTDILTGKIKSGSKLIESALVDRFQISRTPLREALRQLQKEGLLVDDTSLGFQVIELNAQTYREIYETRLVLEKEATKLAVQNITDEQISQIEDVIQEAEALVNEANHLRIMEVNAKFHETIIQFCENNTLVQFWRRTLTLLALYRANVLEHSENIQDSHQEHKAILAAIKKRDVTKAIEEVEIHVIKSLHRKKQKWLES